MCAVGCLLYELLVKEFQAPPTRMIGETTDKDGLSDSSDHTKFLVIQSTGRKNTNKNRSVVKRGGSVVKSLDCSYR